MSWWKRHAATIDHPSATAEPPVVDRAEPPDIDRETALGLIRECGWSHSDAEGWAFEGAVADNSTLTTPSLCHDVLKGIGEQLGSEFETVLLTASASNPLIISSNSPKPFALTTGIQSAEEVGALAAMLLGDGYKWVTVEGTGFSLFIKP